jgi:GLPGLI family protein
MKMGTIVNIITVSDGKTDDLLMLMSGMVGQKAVKTNSKELQEENKQAEPQLTLFEETKTIAGYICKKAMLTDADGNESIYWYNEEIQVSKKGQSYLNEKIPGFPLEYELNQGPMKMLLTVDSFELKLQKKSKELFTMNIPEGYDILTMEELKNMGM